MESVHTKRINTLRWLLIGAIAWPSAMLAGDNHFRTITKRNAFNLAAEPRLAKPVAKPVVEKPTDIKLTGIFKRNGVIAPRSPCSSQATSSPSQGFCSWLGAKSGGYPCRDHRPQKRNRYPHGERQTKELNFKDDAYSSTVTKANRSGVLSNRSTPRREPEKKEKEKKEKKSDAEKLAKINESLAAEKFHRHPPS